MCVRCDRETKRPLSSRTDTRVISHAWSRVPEPIGRHRDDTPSFFLGATIGAAISLVLIVAFTVGLIIW